MAEQMTLSLPRRLRTGDELRAEYGGTAPFKFSPRKAAEFWARLKKPDGEDGCWLWPGRITDSGYGAHHIRGRVWQAHRLAWCIASRRNIPTGLVVRHDCDNRLCCNPGHLRPGTSRENMEDAASRKRMPRGAKHGLSKLNDGKVRRIRQMSANGVRQADIASEFGVSRTAIGNVLAGRTWAWLE